MAPPALDPARQALLDETRRLVGEVASRLEGLGVDEATRKALADSREQLALPFLLVVVGEFNAGKSAFINALARRARPRGGGDADHLAGGHPPARRTR